MASDCLQETVERLAAANHVPGAIVGVHSLKGGTVTAATGVANLGTGAQMTPDTVFLAGSITKVWVATLMMSLVDSGTLELDAPVRRYLPGFDLADSEAAEEVTVRQLLTHSSGIDAADHIPDDLGRGSEAIERYVASLAAMGQLHPPGAYSSYCNAGYVIAGRIIEVVTGLTFEEAMRELLLAPLGVQGTYLSPEESILHRAAVGHFPDPRTGTSVPTPRYLLPWVMAPAGSTLTTTALDMLRFASLHLRLPSAQTVVSDEAVKAMASHQIDMPVAQLGSRGLGWYRQSRGGTAVLSHTGGSLGGFANLVVLPDQGIAYTAFANSSASIAFHEALVREVLVEQFGIELPEPYREEGPARPPVWYSGCYRRREADLVLEPEGDQVVLTLTPRTQVLAAYSNSSSTTLRYVPAGPRSIRLQAVDGPGADSYTAFGIGGDDRRPEFLYFGLRLARREPAEDL